MLYYSFKAWSSIIYNNIAIDKRDVCVRVHQKINILTYYKKMSTMKQITLKKRRE